MGSCIQGVGPGGHLTSTKSPHSTGVGGMRVGNVCFLSAVSQCPGANCISSIGRLKNNQLFAISPPNPALLHCLMHMPKCVNAVSIYLLVYSCLFF